MENLLWWGYRHADGSIRVKRYFDRMDVWAATTSDFCKTILGPFRAADNEEASRLFAEKENSLSEDLRYFEEQLRHIEGNHYFNYRVVNGKLCALGFFTFTIGLMYDLDIYVYDKRYCYQSLEDATEAIMNWDGKGHPSGPWLKCKGSCGDISNPNLKTV